MKIPFNKPLITGKEIEYLSDSIKDTHLAGDQIFTKKCHEWFEKNIKCKKALLTTSCTHALEMAAILVGIKPGDEVIIPSFTFVSTANPFVLRGAKIVFVDINPNTLAIDEKLVEPAITEKTKAIIPVHYSGISCDMDYLQKVAGKYNIEIIEDAAQSIMAMYKENYLGTLGGIGAYSFHETKNFNCGEGGVILLNTEKYFERAEILREKGTNRAKFIRGEIDRYTWIDFGSSYLPSELNSAFLYAQLEMANIVNNKRIQLKKYYANRLAALAKTGKIEIPTNPDYAQDNGHIFYIKLENMKIRGELMEFLSKNGIQSTFHYIPLHSSKAGIKFGKFHGEDKWTTRESERMLRLPMYYSLSVGEIDYICELIEKKFK